MAEKTEKKKTSPFDVINGMFCSPGAFDGMSDELLAQSAFIVNRTFSIKYPMQAQAFNVMGLHPAEMVKAWRQFLSKAEPGRRVPPWCYTKGSRRAGAQKEAASEIPAADVKLYAAYAGCGLADARDLAAMFPAELKVAVKRIKDIQSAKEIGAQIEKTKRKEIKK